MYKIKLPKPYPLQQNILDALHTHRFVTVAGGRRIGKSTLGINAAILTALETGRNVLWGSISYKQLVVMFDTMVDIVSEIAKVNSQQKIIRLINGANIEFFSADKNIADTIRGRKYQLVVLDEAAFINGLDQTFNAVIRPTLIDYRGKGLFLSSPDGMNDFYKFYYNAQYDKSWKSFTATSYDNPHIPKEELDGLRSTLPDRIFRAEILAEFIADGKLFSNVLELSTGQETLEPERGHRYIFGIDIAFQHDYTAIVVLDVTEKKVCRLIKGQWELSILAGLIKQLADTWQPDSINIDATGMGIPVIQHLHPLQLPLKPITFTKDVKQHLIHNLMLTLEQKNITLLDHKEMRHELSIFEEKNGKYSAPDGYHDDIVIALALAVWGMRGYSPLVY